MNGMKTTEYPRFVGEKGVSRISLMSSNLIGKKPTCHLFPSNEEVRKITHMGFHFRAFGGITNSSLSQISQGPTQPP